MLVGESDELDTKIAWKLAESSSQLDGMGDLNDMVTTKTLRSPIFYITCMSFQDSNILSTLQLLSTETDIEEFVCFFRTTFPDASFPPKLHMLEEHVIPFMRKWHFPLGFFGEQGGESVHHEFVQLASTFSHVKPATSRLKKMMEEHHLVVHPINRDMIPERKKRNLKRDQPQQE